MATAINNSGQVVGSLTYSATGQVLTTHAILWSGNIAIELGTLGGASSTAYGINDAGQVVGFSQNSGDGAKHAVLWNGSNPTDLGAFGLESQARDINNAGQVVGYSGTIGGLQRRATLWNGIHAIDLNQFLDADMFGAGWVLEIAQGINESGWITAQAYNHWTDSSGIFLVDSSGAHRAVLMDAFSLINPVPEPQTYALMLVGLGVVGLTARRRKG
jgi:probable HAF family extracellular repeat protein